MDIARRLPFGGLYFYGMNTVSVEWPTFGVTIFRGPNLVRVKVVAGRRKWALDRFHFRKSRRMTFKAVR